MNLSIKPGAATDDAQQIDSIVSTIEKDMETLHNVIDKLIPNEIETEWSIKLQDAWTNYYTEDIPDAMEAMKLSATNLRIAVDEAVKYSQGN